MSAITRECADAAEIAVVIPYFQRERGILARALRSAMAQIGEFQARIVVVDDSSPVPAEEELASIAAPCRLPVQVIRRPNGGPGAARNTGLDSLSPATRYVAFLDSDDEWRPNHLMNAKTALDAGFDAYFADLMQLNATVSGFNRKGRLNMADHPAIAGRGSLHEYVGDMFTQIISGNVIGTSTVVFRFERFDRVRFRPEFRTAGEDYLFWMDLAVAGARFAFSEEVEADYGRGVNVYSGVQWGTVDLLWRIHYEMRYRAFSLENYKLSDEQRALIVQRRLSLRNEFARACLHRIVRLESIPIELVRKHLDAEPSALTDLLRTGLRLRLKP